MGKKLVRNLGDRYKILSGYEIVNLIDKALKETGEGLTPSQRRRLRESFGNSGILGNLDAPFIAYSWEEEKKDGPFIWRLTFPIFFIYSMILFFIVLPIKWLITGKYYLGQTSALGNFNMAWYNKIKDRHWY